MTTQETTKLYQEIFHSKLHDYSPHSYSDHISVHFDLCQYLHAMEARIPIDWYYTPKSMPSDSNETENYSILFDVFQEYSIDQLIDFGNFLSAKAEILTHCDGEQIENGIIKGPGKFEGEYYFVPYFWSNYTSCDEEIDDNGTLVNCFDLSDEDKQLIPELEDYSRLLLSEDNNGFIHSALEK